MDDFDAVLERALQSDLAREVERLQRELAQALEWNGQANIRAEQAHARAEKAERERDEARAVLQRELAYCEQSEIPFCNVSVAHVKRAMAQRLRAALGGEG